MFLIDCGDDRSDCIVEDEDVLFEEGQEVIGKEVTFYSKGRRYQGKVLMRSDDSNVLNTEIKARTVRFKEAMKLKTIKSLETTSVVPGKRSTKKRERWSPSPDKPRNDHCSFLSKKQKPMKEKKNKTEPKSSQDRVREAIKMAKSFCDSDSSSDETTSVGKNNNKMKLSNNKKVDVSKLKNLIRSSGKVREETIRKSEPRSTEQTDNLADNPCNEIRYSPKHDEPHEQKPYSSDSESDDDHVYGKHWESEKMVLLRDNIYCRKTIFNEMKAGSPLPSHIARKLVDGVFRREALLNRTCTGQSARAQGKARLEEKMLPLNPRAKNAIIEYAIERSEKLGAPQKTRKELSSVIAQKLCEIKDELRRRNK